jgi:hypothetical protein
MTSASPDTPRTARSRVVNTLPPVYCPIEPAVHPDARLINQRAIEWMNIRGFCNNNHLRARLERADIGGLAGRLFPEGSTMAVEVLAKYHLWGFAFDDLIENLAANQLVRVVDEHGRLMRMLDVPPRVMRDGDPHAVSFREIYEWFAQLASPAVLRRWIGQTRVFQAGVVWGCVYRYVDAIPNPDSTTIIRMQDAGGGGYGTGLVELAGGFEMPEEELTRDDVQVLTDITHVLLAWDNDIYSYSAEVANEVEQINLVTALAVHGSPTTHQALTQAIQMRNRAMWCYLEHRKRLRSPEDRSTRRYLQGLDHLLRGNLDWGIGLTRRYDTTDPTAPTLALHEEPATQIDGCNLTEPIELPSIRWWWDTITHP